MRCLKPDNAVEDEEDQIDMSAWIIKIFCFIKNEFIFTDSEESSL